MPAELPHEFDDALDYDDLIDASLSPSVSGASGTTTGALVLEAVGEPGVLDAPVTFALEARATCERPAVYE